MQAILSFTKVIFIAENIFNMAYQPKQDDAPPPYQPPDKTSVNGDDDAKQAVDAKKQNAKKKQPKHGRRPSQLDVDELNQLKAAFKFFDQDENGTVDPDEIGAVLKKLGVDIKEDEIKDIMASLDENGDGVMDFDEFVQMMDRRVSINSQHAEIEQTFKVFDKNGDGKITFDELKETLTALGEEVTDKDVADMIKEADLNGDGVIDFEEFKIMMTAGHDDASKNQLLAM